MKKYNVKEIMRKAWEIKKEDIKNVFGECLKLAWAIAKKAKTTINKIVESFSCFNQRRYSDPWVAIVDSDCRPDFSKKIGGYTGGYKTGDAGELYISAPVENTVYVYGQKDTRGNNTVMQYIRFVNNEYVRISKKEALGL